MFSRTLAKLTASLPSAAKYRLVGLKPALIKVMALGQRTVEVETSAGPLIWEIDELTSQEFLLGSYEPYMQKAFIKYVQPGDVVYDIGAHAGYHSLFCSLLVGNSGAVYAFEPNPKNFKSLKRQLELNSADQVCVLPYALSDKCGDARFKTSFGASQGHLSRSGDIRVETRTLDSLIDGGICPIPQMLKIDVEGHEAQVLAGAMGTLKRHRPLVFCDYNDDTSYDVVRQMLSPLGYDVAPGPPITAHPTRESH